MATTATQMVRPPPPPSATSTSTKQRPPPPPPSKKGKRPPPPPPKSRGARPPPPPKQSRAGRVPPPPPSSGVKRPATHSSSSGPLKVAKVKSSSTPQPRAPPSVTPPLEEIPSSRYGGLQKGYFGTSSFIRKPLELRDVNSYTKQKQVGQGMYGMVYLGVDKVTGEQVALKRIKTEQEENGFPITAIREVKILNALKHENIVTLKEIVTSKEKGEIPKNVFMVFEYHEYDLTGILKTSEIKLTQDHIKSWAHQLLSGIHYMHVNMVIHRDLKASNLLINSKGQLRIADFGLARSWTEDRKRLTNCVVTLWYRPPELLLGCSKYSPKIDMWSVGCIIAEMFRRKELLRGSNEAHQLDEIFRTCGHPTTEDWPDIHEICSLWKNFEPKPDETPMKNRIRNALKQNLPYPAWMTDSAMDLIEKLLTHNPEKRWSAFDALTNSQYFYDKPIVKKASELSMKFRVDAVHEWENRQRVEQQQRLRNNGPGK